MIIQLRTEKGSPCWFVQSVREGWKADTRSRSMTKCHLKSSFALSNTKENLSGGGIENGLFYSEFFPCCSCLMAKILPQGGAWSSAALPLFTWAYTRVRHLPLSFCQDELNSPAVQEPPPKKSAHQSEPPTMPMVGSRGGQIPRLPVSLGRAISTPPQKAAVH